jgi:hypothetical protein
MAASDTYIEKDSSVNDEIDRLRHSATAALLTRRDTIVVASVSLHLRHGRPRGVPRAAARLTSASRYDQRSILRRLVDLQYDRNDIASAAASSGCGATPSRCTRRTTRRCCASRCSATRVERHHWWSTRSPASRSAAEMNQVDGLPGHALRGRRGADAQGGHRHRGRAAGAARLVRGQRQAARGPAPAHAHPVRPGDDAGGGLLQRHRELLSMHIDGRGPGEPPVHPARLLPRRLPGRHRREPRGRARSCTASTRATAPARSSWSSTASGCPSARQPAAALRGGHGARQPGRVPVGHPGRLRAGGVHQGGRADRAAHRPGRPRGHRQAHQGPDRRPHRADQRPGHPGRPGAGHHAHQEDGRGPHRLPARAGPEGALPAQRGRHHPAHRDPARPAPRRVRRAGRHQPAARGPRPARGVAGGHPRRRQGGLPAQRDVAHPDHRPRRPQRRRPGDHVRRQGHPVHAAGHRRDQPAPRRQRPTTSSTASTRRPSARPSATSSSTCGRRRPAPRCRARTGAGRPRPTQRRAWSWPSCRATSWNV